MDAPVKPTILYIDDEADNLLVFKSAFRREYTVFTALSGEEGLTILREHPDIALIITDQRMPAMTGVEFLRHLPPTDDSVRMILTGFSDVQAIIDAINSGSVYRYITKPWERSDLKITIDNALEAFQLRRSNKELIRELQEANDDLEVRIEERTLEVHRQKEEIESLLLNILPAETAQELRREGRAQARSYPDVTVLFADIQNFTHIAEQLSPADLVAELDTCFSRFDALMDRYQIEKIKTIGDAYLCVGGLPNPDTHEPARVVAAAIGMLGVMSQLRAERQTQGRPWFEVRIGIHTGPLVAGVVGTKKFAYDIWGDTVNIAARLEQTSEAGRINLSQATYERVKDQFACTPRGMVQAKNKGAMGMYFVESATVPELVSG